MPQTSSHQRQFQTPLEPDAQFYTSIGRQSYNGYYDSSFQEKNISAYNSQQDLDYVPNISLNLMAIAVSQKNCGTSDPTPKKNHSKQQYYSNTAKKNLMTPQKRY